VATGILTLYVAAGAITGSGGLAAPVAIGTVVTAGALLAHGVYEFARGVVEPSPSQARSIPVPYPGTLTVIVATGGNVEAGSAYNNIANLTSAVGKTFDYSVGCKELTNPEYAKLLLDLIRAGYLNPPFIPELGP
jgi:hypothetical protein